MIRLFQGIADIGSQLRVARNPFINQYLNLNVGIDNKFSD